MWNQLIRGKSKISVSVKRKKPRHKRTLQVLHNYYQRNKEKGSTKPQFKLLRETAAGKLTPFVDVMPREGDRILANADWKRWATEGEWYQAYINLVDHRQQRCRVRYKFKGLEQTSWVKTDQMRSLW